MDSALEFLGHGRKVFSRTAEQRRIRETQNSSNEDHPATNAGAALHCLDLSSKILLSRIVGVDRIFATRELCLEEGLEKTVT
jgi:hypothetical protein